MTRIIKACPLCGSGKVTKRRTSENGRYYCDNCKRPFPIPILKETNYSLDKRPLPPGLRKYIS